MKKNFIGVGTALTIGCILLSPFTAYASANMDEAYVVNEICTESYNMDDFSNRISASGIERPGYDKEGDISESKGILYGKKYKVTKKTNFYDGPGTEYAVAGLFYKGNYVTIKSIEGDWGKFKYDGRYCYVPVGCIQREK